VWATSAAGAITGNTPTNTLTLLRALDKMSLTLVQALVSGAFYGNVEVGVNVPAGGGKVNVTTLNFKNVTVVSISQLSSGATLETVTLNYRSVAISQTTESGDARRAEGML
jgi:type VI protein secretion system component Hcp